MHVFARAVLRYGEAEPLIHNLGDTRGYGCSRTVCSGAPGPFVERASGLILPNATDAGSTRRYAVGV